MGLSQGLKDNQRIFALVTNTLAKDKEIDDKWRKFARPVSSRNLANQVEDEVVDALVSAVKASYPQLSHRYYKLKAKWMGVPTRSISGTATRRCRAMTSASSPGARREDAGARCLSRFLARAGGRGQAVLRQELDRRAVAPGQGSRRLCASDRAVARIPICC